MPKGEPGNSYRSRYGVRDQDQDEEELVGVDRRGAPSLIGLVGQAGLVCRWSWSDRAAPGGGGIDAQHRASPRPFGLATPERWRSPAGGRWRRLSRPGRPNRLHGGHREERMWSRRCRWQAAWARLRAGRTGDSQAGVAGRRRPRPWPRRRLAPRPAPDRHRTPKQRMSGSHPIRAVHIRHDWAGRVMSKRPRESDSSFGDVLSHVALRLFDVPREYRAGGPRHDAPTDPHSRTLEISAGERRSGSRRR